MSSPIYPKQPVFFSLLIWNMLLDSNSGEDLFFRQNLDVNSVQVPTSNSESCNKKHWYFGLSPLPGCQSPPGWHYIFRLGDPELNLHLPQLLGGGTTQLILHILLKYSTLQETNISPTKKGTNLSRWVSQLPVWWDMFSRSLEGTYTCIHANV